MTLTPFPRGSKAWAAEDYAFEVIWKIKLRLALKAGGWNHQAVVTYLNTPLDRLITLTESK